MCIYNELKEKEHEQFLRKQKKERFIVSFSRIGILVLFLVLWEAAARLGWINQFITSSPSRVFETIVDLIKTHSLYNHLFVTTFETVAGFTLGTVFGTIIAMMLWWSERLAKILDPYLVVLNALPKVALGPVIIVWAGAGMGSILIMTLAISIVATIIGVYSGFMQASEEKIILLRTFNASKMQIFTKAVFPSSIKNIINALKINVGLSWVGVIMGEFLVSKAGLGYLIVYGSQVFNLDLVMAGVVILSVVAGLMYFLVSYLEKKVVKYD
ncbi:ABC transporter permease [Anaerofustis stercorihominis]|uniref:ABC transporter permease n=1 Tax=Anaerofustis stercorihominis TaxID=214853 RepID=UPI00214BAD49|nr:ABC transporter permease [Anaerofustis stercorihominis]MCR2033022.1 ABC transporter permease [Anaerofustis stercorihominis]